MQVMRQGEIGKARLELEQAWALDPHNASIAAERGRLEFAAGDLLAAETWYAQGVRAAPQSVEAWLARAAFTSASLGVSTDGVLRLASCGRLRSTGMIFSGWPGIAGDLLWPSACTGRRWASMQVMP
jgi:Tfp pilus assembly protein PilF